MNPTRALGYALVVLGVLALVYGSFTYTKDTHDVDLGIVKFTVQDRETVNVPVWAGLAAVAAGAFVLFRLKS